MTDLKALQEAWDRYTFYLSSEVAPEGYTPLQAIQDENTIRASLSSQVEVVDSVKPHTLDISMLMATDICESCGIGRYDDQKIEQIATYIYNCATKGALAESLHKRNID